MSSHTLAQFRDLVRQVPHASDPHVKSALTRLARESRARLTESSSDAIEFFEGLTQALSELRGNANSHLRVSCVIDCGNYFYIAGQVERGLTVLRQGIDLARRAEDFSSIRKTHTLLGVLLADSGCIAQAIEAYAIAMEVARKIDDGVGYAVTVCNLGTALMYACEFDQAIACFDRAQQLATELREDEHSIGDRAWSNKASCCLRQGRIKEGLEAARRAISSKAAMQGGPDRFSLAVREFNYLQLLLADGNRREAVKRLNRIQDLTRQANTTRAGSLAKIAEGMVEADHGDTMRGLELLKQAEGETIRDKTLHQDVLLALVRGYEQLGRYHDALESLQRLMANVRDKRAEGALRQVAGARAFLDSNNDEVRRLEHREAILKAKVAEDHLLSSQIEMLERLAVTADLREEASGEHGYRVGRLAAAIAEQLGWDSDACLALDLAARLHDIGKIGVPDRILLTSQELKEAERHFMCTHTIIGSELLAKSNIRQLRMAEEIALYHHEAWDGSGYPKKLAGKRIPIHARIVAVADVFDALTHGRPYAAPWTIDEAIEEIQRRRVTQFDPEITDCFLVLIQKMRREHPNLDEFLARAGRHSPFLQARRKIKLMLQQEREQEREATVPGNQTRH
jgi:putative two-component system response regulator